MIYIRNTKDQKIFEKDAQTHYSLEKCKLKQQEATFLTHLMGKKSYKIDDSACWQEDKEWLSDH